MSLHRFDARRDSNEKSIIKVLQSFGATVHRLSEPVDLLVGYKGVNYLIEIKTETGTLTKKQSEFVKSWKGRYAICRNETEALFAIGIVI